MLLPCVQTGDGPSENGPARAASSKPQDPEAVWGTSAWGATAAELTHGANPDPRTKLDMDMAQPVDVTDAAADHGAAAAAATHTPSHLIGTDLDRVSASYAHPASVPGGQICIVKYGCITKVLAKCMLKYFRLSWCRMLKSCGCA